jgi:hypothetical protein
VDTPKNNLADPESLLGMLQRGRGKGYLVALEAPPEAVWPLLFECVTNDPRFDKMLEEREEYYASLIMVTAMNLEPFRSHLVHHDVSDDVPDWSMSLLLYTLSCLAEEKKNAAALQILREYVSYGRKWKNVLQVLAEADTPDAVEQTVAAFCHRVRSDDNVRAQFKKEVQEDWKSYGWQDEEARPECHFFLPICEPWKTICARNQELADLFAGVGIAYDQPPVPEKKSHKDSPYDLSLEELFARVNESNCIRFWRFLPEKVSPEDENYLLSQLATGNPQHMILAFRGLGYLGTPRAFDTVKSYIEASENADRKVRRYAFEAIEEMPVSLALPLARQWFRRKEWYLHVPAGGILERHAALEDVPLLREALRTPETIRCEDFRLGSALRAMTRFDGIGQVPELEQVFCRVQDCYWRYEAANAMEITAPVEFAAKYAFECLWDCHEDTRELGCEVVNLSTPGALERLRELAADAGECDDVRQAAQEALSEYDASAPIQ